MNEIEVRKKLQRILEETPNDYTQILELSSKLSSFDKENIRFSVDAGVIDRLGSELVAKQETAVSELVKNAYDADAFVVKIKFENSDKIGGTLFIEDNGVGMTKEQLINGFMRISSSSKIHEPYSERFNRKRAGQKGIGRFAVQRLGEKLTIVTQTLNSSLALVLSIDWNKYTTDVDLFSIDNAISYQEKLIDEGTILKIDGLKDKWSEASIKRIYNYVNDILQPFTLNDLNSKTNAIPQEESQSEKDAIEDPGFDVEFSKIINDKKIIIADDKSMIYDHALAIFNGFVDEKGKALYSIESKILNIDDIYELSSNPDYDGENFKHLKHVKFRAYYYIYKVNLIPKMQETSINRLARKFGGIRLYRNGFRVLPYGEPNDDWLGLDESTVKRSILPTHANINFFGFVEITDKNNLFNETSSREGLLENEALIELKNFVYRTIMSSVIKIAEIRNTKIVSNQKKNILGVYETIEIKIKNIAFTLEELDKVIEKQGTSIEVKRQSKKKLAQAKEQLEELKRVQKEEKEEYLRERSMLRVLSSVGLTISIFLHEVRDYTININSDINFLMEVLKNDLISLKRIQTLQHNVETFNTYLSYFDYIISQNIVRDLKPLEIQNHIETFWKTVKTDCEKSKIEFLKPNRESYYLFSTPMHPSELSSVFFNLYTNAKKAINRTNNKGKISVRCFKEDRSIKILFSDNGDGIKEEFKERIFEEFFTSSSPRTISDLEFSNEMTGTGLGLKIVKDIITSYRGKIYVNEIAEIGFTTTFTIELNLANDKILEKYGL